MGEYANIEKSLFGGSDLLATAMEACGGPVNSLQPRIKADPGFRSYNLAFSGFVRYFLKVLYTFAYRPK